MSMVPPGDEQTTIQRVDYQPVDERDAPGVYRKFLDGLRALLGIKSLYWADRWASAKVDKSVIENEAALMQATADYERGAAEAYRLRREADAKYLESEARAEFIRAQAARLRGSNTAASEILESTLVSQEEAAEELVRAMERLRMCGGLPEIDLSDQPWQTDQD